MGYNAQPKLRIDLSDLGTDAAGNPFYVEIKNPKLLTFGQKLEMGKVAQAKDDNEKVTMMKSVVSGLILSWNLIDMETEAPVNAKAEDSLEHVPSEVVETIMKSLKPQTDEPTKNSSEQ